MAAVANDRPIRGDGSTAEPDWRAWLARSAVPVVPFESLLRPAVRLVVVAPHPDDEVLMCGGVLALHAQRGGEVLVLAVTDGEASHEGAPGWTPARLAATRRIESARGLAHLGIGDDVVTRLGLPDSAAAAHAGALSGMLQRQLRATDVVASTWRLDGHPDHDAVGAAVAQACERTGCRLLEAPVWMWHWGAPADPRVPWPRLRAVPLPPAALAAKAAALAEHATQRTPRGDAGPVLGPAIVARAARPAEYFFI